MLEQVDEEDKQEQDENQADIEEGKDVENIKEEVKEADEVDRKAQIVKTLFLEEKEQEGLRAQVWLHPDC